jgi:Sec-independent protein translocase protein TatA
VFSVTGIVDFLPIIIIIIIIIIKTRVIPVIIGATGTISKSFRKYVSNIPGNMKLGNYRKQPYWALHTHTSESANVKVR